jgi:hypothetical protein
MLAILKSIELHDSGESAHRLSILPSGSVMGRFNVKTAAGWTDTSNSGSFFLLTLSMCSTKFIDLSRLALNRRESASIGVGAFFTDYDD